MVDSEEGGAVSARNRAEVRGVRRRRGRRSNTTGRTGRETGDPTRHADTSQSQPAPNAGSESRVLPTQSIRLSNSRC